MKIVNKLLKSDIDEYLVALQKVTENAALDSELNQN